MDVDDVNGGTIHGESDSLVLDSVVTREQVVSGEDVDEGDEAASGTVAAWEW